MFDKELKHIEMPPLPEEPVVEQEETEAVTEEAQPEQEVIAVQENSKDRNFRIIRERAERADRLERERDELLRRVADYEARSKPAVVVEEEDDDFQIGADDLAEGKHLKKVASKIHKLEQRISQYQQQSEVVTIESRLKQQYADFDKVVSADNIKMLREAYPELATTINTSTDLYNKAVSAYTMIKKLGIAQDDTFVADRLKAHANASKPKPLASVSPQQGDSPLSRANSFANGLTEDLKQQLYKEMLESRKAM